MKAILRDNGPCQSLPPHGVQILGSAPGARNRVETFGERECSAPVTAGEAEQARLFRKPFRLSQAGFPREDKHHE